MVRLKYWREMRGCLPSDALLRNRKGRMMVMAYSRKDVSMCPSRRIRRDGKFDGGLTPEERKVLRGCVQADRGVDRSCALAVLSGRIFSGAYEHSGSRQTMVSLAEKLGYHRGYPYPVYWVG